MEISDNIVAQAAARFGVGASDVKFVREGANLIYEFSRGGQVYYLRLAPGSQRDKDLIRGEMDFIAYLAEGGARVPRPVRSLEGRLVEVVNPQGILCNDVGETYLAAVFERVHGSHLEGEALTNGNLQKWGQGLGRIHRLGKRYRPSLTEIRRPQWDEMDVFQLESLIPTSRPVVLEQCRELLGYLATLPRTADGYGLIHGDPEPWNIFLHDGELTFIDFDECCYHWFIFDLAVALIYAVLAAGTEEPVAFARHAWDQLYAGYRQENALPQSWVEKLPVFMRLRMMEDYVFHLNLWDMDDLEGWQQWVLTWQCETIETGAPVFGVTRDWL